MTRLATRLVTRLSAIGFALSLGACFAPENPVCAFACDDSVGNGRHCPDDYECRPDGYCHLVGSAMVACSFPQLDMPMSAPGDMAASTAGDMATANGDMATAAGDMLASPDLLTSLDGAAPDLTSHD